jgi:hypothetical protein
MKLRNNKLIEQVDIPVVQPVNLLLKIDRTHRLVGWKIKQFQRRIESLKVSVWLTKHRIQICGNTKQLEERLLQQKAHITRLEQSIVRLENLLRNNEELKMSFLTNN